MSSAPESTTPLPSFLERFLEERSIKWMLGLGMLVLLGSSLKFVTAHWETYSPFWKYLVLIAYTAVMYGMAEVGLHRLMLRRTGTGLLALTLCLLPLTFLALRWVAPGLPDDVGSLVHDVGLGTLLVINLGFTALASRRILRTLLRRVPVTYWLAYLTLCVCGALAPAVPTALAPLATVVLWMVLTAGVVKVNRHVFWLAEEEQWPRIFSFFPTALLAAQFMTVFMLNLGADITTPWWGFGLVLVAMPVLLTADAAARVFQQRTGAIVFPWPAQIMAPLVIGLVACLAGLVLAMTDLPRPIALAPTAALCALCFGTVARRTGHQVFAWAMLLCLLTAYQFTPVYFQSFAKQVVQTSAEMVGERRLPYAFYAITYAPFILGLVVAGRRLKSELFAVPCRQLSVVLASVMLLASWTDPKAVFIAGAMLTVLWTVLRWAYADVRCQWGIGLSWLSAAWGLQVFLSDICHMTLPADFSYLALTAAAGVLGVVVHVVPTRRMDGNAIGVWEFLSTITGVLLAAGWIGQYGGMITTAGTIAVVPALVLLMLHQRRRAYPLLGEMLLILSSWVALRYGMATGVEPITLSLTSIIVLVTGWAVSQAAASRASSLTLRAFQQPLARVTTGGLAACQLLAVGGLIVLPDGQLTAAAWIAAALVTAWSFLASGRVLPTVWVHVGCVSVLAIIGRGLFQACDPATAGEWLPFAWGMAALLGGGIARRIDGLKEDTSSRVALHVDQFALTTEVLLAIGTLGLLSWPVRLAAGLVLLSLALRTRRPSHSLLKHAVVELSFLQFLVVLLACVAPNNFLLSVPSHIWVEVQIVGTFLVAAWLMLLKTPQLRRFVPNEELLTQQVTFWELASGLSTLTLLFTQTAPLTVIEVAALAGLFGLLIADRFRTAVRTNNPEDVWYGLVIGAVGVGYVVAFQILPLFSVTTLGAGLAAGLLLSALARRCSPPSKYAVLARPFHIVGYGLPAVIAALCVGGSLFEVAAVGTGVYSLLILGAAMCYFVRWLEHRDQISLLIATGIFNVSQMLLWHELSWSDPQLYLMPLGLSLIGLVEGLPRELRTDGKTVLRYAGALVILVSPLFHILDGGWLPLLTLMAASLGVSVLSLGLKSRPLLYSGTAFLVADLIALVARGSLERTDLLWIVGIALGTSVIALAAYCENHRELVLQRLRMLSATLQTWA